MNRRFSSMWVCCAVLLGSGCTSPPMAPPDALRDYRPVSQFTDVIPEDERNDINKVCRLIPSVPPKSPPDSHASSSSEAIEVAIAAAKDELKLYNDKGFVRRPLQKLYIRSCEYAFYSDRVKDFKALSDEATLGFATITAVGALTDSHTDFVKSMAGLTGLTGGLRVYANPSVQMATYIKAANATQCLAGTVVKLEKLVSAHQILTTSLIHTERNIEAIRGGMNKIKYSPELQQALLTMSPGPEVLNLLNESSDPDSDAASKKAALAFLKNIETLTDENLRTIYGRIVATLNAQAFNVESATQPIASTHAGLGDGSDGEKVVANIKASNQYKELLASGETNPADTYVNIVSSLNTARAEDSKIPYSELIRLNGEFDDCMKKYAAN